MMRSRIDGNAGVVCLALFLALSSCANSEPLGLRSSDIHIGPNATISISRVCDQPGVIKGWGQLEIPKGSKASNHPNILSTFQNGDGSKFAISGFLDQCTLILESMDGEINANSPSIFSIIDDPQSPFVDLVYESFDQILEMCDSLPEPTQTELEALNIDQSLYEAPGYCGQLLATKSLYYEISTNSQMHRFLVFDTYQFLWRIRQE